MSPELAAAGRRSFVALGTYRRSGARVVTAVWIARRGDALVVRTALGTGKAKRLRNDGRVTLQECSRTGRVRDGAPLVMAHAVLQDDPLAVEAASIVLGRKYGLQWRIAMALQRRSAARNGTRYVTIRITDDPA